MRLTCIQWYVYYFYIPNKLLIVGLKGKENFTLIPFILEIFYVILLLLLLGTYKSF